MHTDGQGEDTAGKITVLLGELNLRVDILAQIKAHPLPRQLAFLETIQEAGKYLAKKQCPTLQ